LPAQFVTGVAAIALAEFLILKKRFFWTGIELALWLVGVMNLIFSLPSSGKPEALIVIGGGLGLVGLRLRNALAGVAGASCIVVYAAVKAHDGLPAIAVALVLTLAAAIAMTREWQRRSTEQLLQAFVLVLPAVAYIVAIVSTQNMHPYIEYALLAATLLILGLRNRDRVLLIAGAFAITIAGIDASQKYIHIDYQWKLIDGGVIALVIALVLSRLLRGRTRGFTASPEAAKSYEEAIQLLGAMQVTHAAARESSAGDFQPGGGSFGGGGASTGY
jgi:uncharacterized membrane protein YgcG